MHPDELLHALRREGDAFAALADKGLDAAVPPCPGWDVRTLVNHLGRVHTWAATVVSSRATERPAFPGRPEEVTVEWFRQALDGLVDALGAAGPDAPAWNWTGRHQQARWWFRREAIETAVHRRDAEAAHGQASPIDVELAVYGVDEVLDGFLPVLVERKGGAAALGLGGSLRFEAADSPHGDWLVGPVGDELLVGHGHGGGDAVVRATASDLLLLLWGRLDPGDPRLEVSGDAGILARWQATLVPG